MIYESKTLNREETEAFGRELDAIRRETLESLGQNDVDHIKSMIRLCRLTEGAGRALLHFGLDPATFVVGTGALAFSKILENMEVGHNVMHGQYDFARDPELSSHDYEWDIVCPSVDWRHSHNYEHHTFTNVLGLDRDIGYAFLRVVPEQKWNVFHLAQPLTASVLALYFQWGVAMHDLRILETLQGQQTWRELRTRAKPFMRKATKQLAKDYLFFPALSLWNAPRVAFGNLLANGARNVWTFGIIFCGHFPEGVKVYREEDTRAESRGAWYLRQLNGSANIEGGQLFHRMSGHLSHQIEHHLFPDIPAARYPELAPRVRAICERYGQAYNSGSLRKQLGSVAARLCANALPSRAKKATQGRAQHADAEATALAA